MKNEQFPDSLYIELQSIANRGITIWLEGSRTSPLVAAKEMMLHEECSYMRDYVFDEGELKELHFDKIVCS
jgi:hypothetical protein